MPEIYIYMRYARSEELKKLLGKATKRLEDFLESVQMGPKMLPGHSRGKKNRVQI